MQEAVSFMCYGVGSFFYLITILICLTVLGGNK